MLPAKLTLGSTFPIHPALAGGQLRILNLYRRLATRFPVDVISLVVPEEASGESQLAPGLREVRVPKTIKHALAESKLEREAGLPIGDIAFAELHELTPGFARAVRASLHPNGALVASHPFSLPALRAASADAPLWYDAHNVEADLKAAMLPDNVAGTRLLEATQAVERACCQGAELVIASSHEDSVRLQARYGIAADRLTVVPNGIDTGAIRFVSPTERQELRARLRMKRPLALFIGSWHEPNLVAVRRILELAPQLPEVGFAIVGSVALPLRDLGRPENVELFGVVQDDFKRTLLGVASVALNPMSAGSGTNMKMLDYLAAGVPVVSTEIGARGLDPDIARHLQIAPLERFADAVTRVLAQTPAAAEVRLREARRLVEERLDWAAVAGELLGRLERSAEPARRLQSPLPR